MRREGSRTVRRPRAVVLGPVAVLVAAVASGLGMWHVLMQDGSASSDRLARQERPGGRRVPVVAR